MKGDAHLPHPERCSIRAISNLMPDKAKDRVRLIGWAPLKDASGRAYQGAKKRARGATPACLALKPLAPITPTKSVRPDSNG